MVIESLTNEKVKKWVKLHQKKYRDEYGLFLIEEEHLIEEALKAEAVLTIIMIEGINNIFNFDNVVFVSGNVMRKISNNVSEVNYIAVCKKLEERMCKTDRVLVLDKVQDPGNLGTLIRSALSFGFDQILLSEDCVDIYNEKVIRATQGAIFHINFKMGDLVEELGKLSDYNILAFSLDNSNYLSELKVKDKLCIVLGNEGQGISKEVFECCNQKVKIEMKNFESLNVAVAGSIAMYNFRNI